MGKISSESLAVLCPQLFGVALDRKRLDTVIGDWEIILCEIMKLRELDLQDLDPVVIFDPLTVDWNSDDG